MKNYIFLVILIFLMRRSDAQTWNLVWSDEFTNTTINTGNWMFETGGGGWGNGELQNYTNRVDNAIISNGNLLIIGKKESFGGSNYTSARMITKGKQSWTYGKIEAKIKFPSGKGIWPAFWMLGDNISTVGWPACGEIDIMEHINTEPLSHGTIHWDNNGHAQYGGSTTVDINKYHVYSVEWDSNAINWFLDGTKFWTANIANNINSTDEFHKPQFILLNMAIGGSWPGSPDNTTIFPDTLFVDYVRVYQQFNSTNVITQKAEQFDISFYPNPASNNILINYYLPINGSIKISIFDLLGKEVISFINETQFQGKQQLDFNITNLNEGLYFIKANSKGKEVIKKLVINR